MHSLEFKELEFLCYARPDVIKRFLSDCMQRFGSRQALSNSTLPTPHLLYTLPLQFGWPFVDDGDTVRRGLSHPESKEGCTTSCPCRILSLRVSCRCERSTENWHAEVFMTPEQSPHGKAPAKTTSPGNRRHKWTDYEDSLLKAAVQVRAALQGFAMAPL